MRRLCLVPLLVIAACKHEQPAVAQRKVAEPARKLAGVYPEDFKCDSIATTAVLAGVLGGAVRKLDNDMPVPHGVPRPCNYQVQAATPEYWRFDIDCRPGLKLRANALFSQFRAKSAANVAHYAALADAGALEHTDAGPTHAPSPAVDVQVGARGIDVLGQGLIFVDDDAPCTVRVLGPDAARRLALAKLVAKNLTFANAPMTPRPMR